MRWVLFCSALLLSIAFGQEAHHQPVYKLVEVEGRAAIAGGNEVAAREAARADAIRRAVEQVVGTYVESEGFAENYQLVYDRIYTRAHGFAAIESVVQEGALGDIYYTRVRVKVFVGQNTEGKEALLTALSEQGLLRQLRVMVVIPEQHIRENAAPLPVPDPAAETAIMRSLARSGFKVVDQQFVNKIRDSRVVKELMRGTVGLRQLHDLRARYGADIIVVGEAFSQRVPAPVDAGNLVFCRSRVEIKAVLAETGEIISADAEHGAGRDLAEQLASKKSLEQTADLLAPRLINDLLVGGYGSPGRATANMELEISGWRRLADAQRFLDAVEQMRGVRRVHLSEFKGGVLFAEVEVDQNLKKRLATVLETLRGFTIEVEAVSGSKIEGVVKDTAQLYRQRSK